MAAGKAIVASNLVSLKNYLNKDNSVLFEPENSDDLANKLRYLLSNPKIAGSIAQQALVDSKRYSWLNRAEEITGFIS
jgi:glycosyltransferase involved in cell wall biosynthesis